MYSVLTVLSHEILTEKFYTLLNGDIERWEIFLTCFHRSKCHLHFIPQKQSMLPWKLNSISQKKKSSAIRKRIFRIFTGVLSGPITDDRLWYDDIVWWWWWNKSQIVSEFISLLFSRLSLVEDASLPAWPVSHDWNSRTDESTPRHALPSFRRPRKIISYRTKSR